MTPAEMEAALDRLLTALELSREQWQAFLTARAVVVLPLPIWCRTHQVVEGGDNCVAYPPVYLIVTTVRN